MGAFGGLVLTNKGIALQMKAQAGAELRYTRVAIGDGVLGSQPIANLTSLISEKISLDITKLRVLGQGRAVIGAVLTNRDLTSGFYFREIGIFAVDPDDGEILYAYANAGSNAEYIPPGGGPDVVEKHIDSVVVVGQAPNVTAVIDQSLVFATLKDMNDHRTAEVLDHPDGSVTAAKLAAGSVTDEKIGDRTISDTSAPSGNSGTLTAILGWLANMIKSITGKSNWRTPPATTLETAKAHMDATTSVHGATSAATPNTLVQRDPAGRFKAAAPAEEDDVARKHDIDRVASSLEIHKRDDINVYPCHVYYSPAWGTADNYFVDLSDFGLADTPLIEGLAIAVKIPVDNTGPSRLTVGAEEAKSIKRQDGTDVQPGNLKAGFIYTLRYNGSVFLLQGG
jgi:hypothetical protein